tara:strand:- start:4884 stop:5501 length:618 start_codon:yes stop_codon:yes gene_type:complete
MNKSNVLKLLKNIGYSHSSIEKIEDFSDFLIKFNKRYNLISRNTVNNIWSRHILDSAQLVEILNQNNKLKIADFGSGAGFPGLIIAFFDGKYKFHVKLFEKSPVKRLFLERIRKEFSLINVEVHGDIYSYNKISTDIIVCRAFKKLQEILKISREIVQKPHKIIILKGKNAQSEINKVSLATNYSYKLKDSITDNKSKIIIMDAK